MKTTRKRPPAVTGKIPLRILGQRIIRNYDLYLYLLPTLLYFAVFHYGPMYGIQIAFKDFYPAFGIAGSPWIGFDHFQRFFRSHFFNILIRNTLVLSFYGVLMFPVPVIFALMLNQIRHTRYKRLVQTVSYAPHFISTVVLVGMLFVFLSPTTGMINNAVKSLGGPVTDFMGKAKWFRHIYIWSGVWQNTGWAAIIYLAALMGINPELHEAAIMDGATKLRRIFHVDIPGILPTVVVMLILRSGRIMSVGFEKAFLMQTALNLDTSEIIATYVYKTGLLGAQFSFASAVGLFNSIINLILITLVNRFARVVGGSSLW